MATTTLPPTPAPAPPPRDETLRFVQVYANLVPDEVIAGRRASETKRRVLIGLAIVFLLLVGWYAVSRMQTSSADSSLSRAQRQTAALREQEAKFGPLVTAQVQSTAIKAELARIMSGDLQWTTMLRTLQRTAPAGVALTSVTGTVTAGGSTAVAGAGAVGGYGVLNQSGKQQVGTLTITGTAPDKNSVAKYIDQLNAVPGLAAAFPGSVTVASGKVTFTAEVIITSDALGGRFTPTAVTPAVPTTPQGGH